jgi:hypothetical protein
VYLYFYNGYGPSSTITTVSAGGEYYMATKTLNPYKNVTICTIGVSYDNATDYYEYRIYPDS